MKIENVNVPMNEQGPSDTGAEACEVAQWESHTIYQKLEDIMSKGNLEISLPELFLEGEIFAEVYEVGGAKPTSIIRTDQDWGVKIHWDLKGSLAPLLCGEWCVHLCLESIGPGPELRFDHPHIHLDPCGNGEYYVDFRIPRGKITGKDCSYPYKLVVTVTYLTACEKPGPIAGFVEGPILQFYEPDGKPIYETEKRYEE